MQNKFSANKALLWTLTLLLLTSGLATAQTPAGNHPNIVFIFTDDQRWDSLGVVQKEMAERARFPWLQTPNIDRLAAEGMRFREAFVVNSICSPSRACMLSGQYSHRNGIVNNHTDLPENDAIVPKQMHKAGYLTGMFGKWHMGDQRGKRPGFDVSKSFIGHGRYMDCPFEINGKQTPTKGWVDDVTTDYTIDFIKDNADRPFFAWVGFKSPHDTRTPAPADVNAYRNETPEDCPNLNRFPIPYMNAKQAALGAERNPKYLMDYFRTLNGVDRCVGRIMEALDKLDLTENTLIIFSSDNGYYLGEHCKTDKRMANEESLRVPLIMRWPQQIPAGSLQDAMVLNIDLSSTFIDLAGADIPAAMQGRSLAPLLNGTRPASWRTAYFYEYFYENNTWPCSVTAVRNQTHKLIKYHFHEPYYELFDIAHDPYETRNLFYEPAQANLKESMLKEYQQQRDQCGYTEPDFADTTTRTWPDPL